MNYLLRTSFRRAMYNKTTHRDSLPSRIWKCVTGLLQWPPLPPPLSPHLVPTAPKRTQWAWDVVKWDWRRVAESGRITGVCRQTADRERNWVRERPPRGRSSTSRQMHCQRFAYSTIAVMLSSPWPNIRDKTLDEWGFSSLLHDHPVLCYSWITAWEHPNHLPPWLSCRTHSLADCSFPKQMIKSMLLKSYFVIFAVWEKYIILWKVEGWVVLRHPKVLHFLNTS